MKTFTARVLLTPGGTGGASKLHRSFGPLRMTKVDPLHSKITRHDLAQQGNCGNDDGDSQ